MAMNQISVPTWMPRLAFSPPHSNLRGDVLVVIFLRGAADALNMVVPYGEPAYYSLRPSLAIPHPDDRKASPVERAIDLDGFFGLHPALRPLLPVWQERHLAVVHACGAPDESRSHFKAMELMERGVADERGPASGWLGRHLASLENGSTSPLRAVGLGPIPQRSLRGAVPVTALRSISDFHMGGDPHQAAQTQAALSALYDGQSSLDAAGRETLTLLQTLETISPQSYKPKTGTAYPETDFGQGLRQITALVLAEVGLEAAAIDLGGWDTHFAQGSSSGWMANLLAELAQGLAAFYTDLSAYLPHLSVVILSEFGRRGRENGSLGTDHGHGSLMLLLGGGINGGRLFGTWPGLQPGQLVGPGDLAVTTDYRDVLAELCARRLQNPRVEQIFPGHQAVPLEIYVPKTPL